MSTNFEILKMVMFQVEVFWVVMLCSVVVGYQRFGRPCCLHLQGEVDLNNTQFWYFKILRLATKHPALRTDCVALYRMFLQTTPLVSGQIFRFSSPTLGCNRVTSNDTAINSRNTTLHFEHLNPVLLRFACSIHDIAFPTPSPNFF
jgi:hypothetical protein